MVKAGLGIRAGFGLIGFGSPMDGNWIHWSSIINYILLYIFHNQNLVDHDSAYIEQAMTLGDESMGFLFHNLCIIYTDILILQFPFDLWTIPLQLD